MGLPGRAGALHAALLAALALLSCGRDDRRHRSPAVSAPRMAAHRGATSAAPENTLAAIRRAFDAGADGVEVDLRLSADGVPVLVHDEDTGRVAGVPRRVAEQTAAELAALDLGGGARVPPLAAARAGVPAGRVLWLDLKLRAGEVERALAGLPRPAPVALQAFDLDLLIAARALRPDLSGLWLVSAPRDRSSGARGPIPLDVVDTAQRAGIAGLAIDHRGLTPALLEAARGAGLELYVWTYPTPEAARAAAPAGAAWIEAEY